MTGRRRRRTLGGRRRARGFTLIELMITIAVLAILVAIAYPAYQDQMRKSRRAEAQVSLMQMANLEERFFANASPPRYTGTIATLGYTATSSGGNYTLSITGPSATGYTAQAQVVAGSAQAGDTKCWTFTLNQLGTPMVTDSGGSDKTAECWRR